MTDESKQNGARALSLRQIAEATAGLGHIRSDYVIAVARAIERAHGIHEAALPTPAPTMVDERGAFELHYAQIWKERTGKTQSLEELCAVIVSMRDGDDYNDGTSHQPVFINALWQGWQARATRPTLQSLGGDAGVSEAPLTDAQVEDLYELACRDWNNETGAFPSVGVFLARRIFAALSLTSTEKSVGWLPIEQAPKDGQRFLGFYRGRVDFFHWQESKEFPGDPVGWRDSFINVYPEGSGPTHYLPLPAAPKAAEKSGRSE